jgi:lactoylglutathione lyase
MKRRWIFVLGIALGAVAMRISAQDSGIVGLHHVALRVANIDDALKFYTQSLGFREVIVRRDAAGRPSLAYIQVSKNTFLELHPVAAGREPGLDHFGFQVDDVSSYAKRLAQTGVKADDVKTGTLSSRFTNAYDPMGQAMELMELGPESVLGKAVNTWK